MTTRYVRAVVVSAGIAVLTNGTPLAQAPNQASLVTQTVAGVKFSTLPGFVIERMNPPEKGDSYVVITFDSLGRLVVSKELDFPRILLDNNKDGIYESEKVISEKVRNCQGLWFEGRTLYAACAMVPTPEQVAAAPPPQPGGGLLRRGLGAGPHHRPHRDRPGALPTGVGLARLRLGAAHVW